MIVRVPDYFSEFSCIAGDCKDSCCLGWEIDIDEDSYEYYQTLPGEVGERLRKGMYETEDGGHGIRTNNCGRCIMLNDKNLCDLYIAAGETSLSPKSSCSTNLTGFVLLKKIRQTSSHARLRHFCSTFLYSMPNLGKSVHTSLSAA